MMRIDARLPLRFGPLDSRRPNEAVLTDGVEAQAPMARFAVVTGPGLPHGPDCACCLPRSAAATALSDLFRTRAIASGTAFQGVLAVVGEGGEAAVRSALADDPVVSARFRAIQG